MLSLSLYISLSVELVERFESQKSVTEDWSGPRIDPNNFGCETGQHLEKRVFLLIN